MKDDCIRLMLKDNEVLYINFNKPSCIEKVVNKNLLPHSLVNKLIFDNNKKDMSIYRNNYDAIIGFLARRVLPLSRVNAKMIYNLFNLEQLQDDYSKAKIAITCRAISLQDNYWIKAEDDHVRWCDVNIRDNPLNEIVAQVALHGRSFSIDGSYNTPELTGQGSFAKAWKREKNNSLWLYKKGDIESLIEVCVSDLLDKCNVSHVKYYKDLDESFIVCKCECMTTEDISILPAVDFVSYCHNIGSNWYDEIIKLDPDGYYKMCIVDYLISNSDRHGMNWGLFYKSNTRELLGCHPLYDHNLAFSKAYMENAESKYLYGNGRNIREAAIHAMDKTNFIFLDTIERNDFLEYKHYKSFLSRAKELGIKQA